MVLLSKGENIPYDSVYVQVNQYNELILNSKTTLKFYMARI